MVRVPAMLHRKLALEAAETGISLNRLASAKLAG
jgi:predicted HicB family RNase H-like nuclease